ncbi:MAG TPA: RNA polymerase sigma factor [Candidatus Methanoperedens sp.]|nr:RNA polymerase sigma factor [Candidatus Methanoperedens sp.]
MMEATTVEPSDLELVRLARAGDASALERLFERHYRTAYRMAWHWCGSRQDAEDAAQEAFIKVTRGLASFREGSSFTTWLYRIVVNAAMDQHRRAAARARLAEEAARSGPPAAMAAAPAAVAAGDCDAAAAWEAIGALPEKQRTALLLVFGEGLSHREAAAVMACPEVTVSWRIHQARKRLGRIMESAR